MSTTFPMYADVARTEVDQRLREAAAQHRRRLARQGSTAPRRGSGARWRHVPWR